MGMVILRLKELMTLKGLSRDDLATKVGVSKTTISNISSEKSLPAISLLLQIAEVLDVDIREMFVSTRQNSVSQSEIDEAKELIANGLKILSGRN